MSIQIEEKIKTLAEIRRDHKEVKYLTLYQATVRIGFLLSLIDELTDAMSKIHKLAKEVK
jgi:hypothetical protein